MNYRAFFPFAMIFLVMSIGCLVIETARTRAPNELQRQAPEVIKEPAFSGVIFPASMKPFRYQFPEGVTYWTPTHLDVSNAENELLPFLRNSKDPRVPDLIERFASYKRQYAGIIVARRKYLYINLFCETYGADWTRREVYVLDGYTCYFNVRFDTETKTFSHLQINGRA